MTLEELRVILVAAAVGTDVNQVVFDYANYMNHGSKTYPLALWDFNNLEGEQNVTSGEKVMRVNCWMINLTTPEADVVDRHKVWDVIEADMQEYMASLNGEEDLTVENIRAMPYEYFPAGLLSLEREMAVRYQVELKLWC